MTNTRRFNLPGLPQHIVQRGNNGQRCFAHDEDFSEYLIRLSAASRRFDVRVHAYVLMSNHVHLLATPASADGVGKLMQAVGSGYVRSFNLKQARTGTLWDGRYFSSLVGGDAYFWNCHRYIELNPVRAGIVSQPGHYRWSSFASNANGTGDSVITPHPAYLALSGDRPGRCAGYREMFESPVGQEVVSEIRERLRKERAFGSEEFLACVEAATPRSPRCRARGRPRLKPATSCDN